MYVILCLVLTMLLISPLSAQRMPDRFVVFNPLFNTAENLPADSTAYIHSFGGYGEFAGYGIKRDFEHAWNQKLGTFVEFFRTGSSSSLSFVANIEFVANSDNDISFKPRSIFWEEGLVYTQKVGKNYWQLAYMHRCKHDIDNYHYGKQRALIFGSIQGKFLIPLDLFDETQNALFAARGELYTIRLDDRHPKSWIDFRPDWEMLIGSLGINFNFTKQLSRRYWNYYLSSFTMLNFYGKDEDFFDRFHVLQEAKLNFGLATGISIRGKAEFRIGLTYDFLSDTGINPYPEQAHLIKLGVLILSHTSYK